ncbi:DUF1223 domain-containing protein [Ciceribacter sp. L1K23]|uniref:DUF1223 domain-containing protein n=1 Tax=unclassified Ciceribacter TaxID=2628820 RepID=UPI001ABDE829|nr:MULTISPECIES: DUF1223 domain-containing protein [unclassified Ciceribacter]MBO3758240.1 DUF1223 domain-containing protein [Ciceribacter sp. L1K22]MBR0557683.1 DUF1223 domain-containing protein [Ciceribacter sp. L1K23]
MTRWLFGWTVVLALVASGSVHAGDSVTPKGVVEIFTSQGCSSCPAADKTMGQLISHPDIVALAYHVDYWNYRGWTDTMASPEHTARQYGYAHTLGRSGVYTPQAILNGREQAKGNDVNALTTRLETLKGSGKGLDIAVNAAKIGDEIEITVGEGEGRADVVVAYFKHRSDVEIGKGTNKGTKVANWNSVTDVQTVGMWTGKPMRFVLPAKVMDRGGSDGFAVLVQTTGPDGQPSAILGAAMLSKWGHPG